MATINKSREKQRKKAEQEIDTKKALEVLMATDLVLFFSQLASDYEIVYGSTGRILNLNESYLEELRSLLKKNYRKVSDVFDSTTRNEIANLVDLDKYELNEEVNDKLQKKIAMVIGAYLLGRADSMASKIGETIQNELITQTNNVLVENASRGIAVGNAEVASTVANNFAEWGINHSKIVATTEVQDVAESSKFTENDALTDLASEDGDVDITTIQKGSEKVWLTAGDEKVRASHSAIDGTIVKADDVFVTGMGGRMRFCGDMSLGADLSDVINCRCETIYRYNTEVTTIIRNKIYRKKGII